MASNEGADANNNHGSDWEVVSLTASTYAASPGPKKVDSINVDLGASDVECHAESSHILFRSRHFAYPPSGQDQRGHVGMVEDDDKGCKIWEKEEKDWALKGLNFADEYPGIDFLDKKDKGFSSEGAEFEEAKSSHEFDSFTKEENLYTAATSSLHAEAALGAPTFFAKSEIPSNDDGILDCGPVCSPSPDPSQSSKLNEDDNTQKSVPGFPYSAWLKRGAVALYAQARDANAFWSVFVSAAVVGLVILGNRWQKERWQVFQLRWHLSINVSDIVDHAE